MTSETCSTLGCEKPRSARDLCKTHYLHWRKNGEDRPRCSEEACEKAAYVRGLCSRHYSKNRQAGMYTDKVCSFEDCGRGVCSKGLCFSHAAQLRTKGTLAPIKVWGDWNPWFVNTQGYIMRRRSESGKQVHQFQHRVVMEEVLGRPLLRSEEVHHKNGDRADNRPENLEVWNTSQPAGQRPEDKVEYALEILRLYAPQHLVID